MAKAKRTRPADELGLLEAIHADPRSDAPRLLYADWLEERGNPAYEMIRWQIATRQEVYVNVTAQGWRLAHFSGPTLTGALPSAPGQMQLQEVRFCQAILPELDKWLRPFPGEVRKGTSQITFARGLPSVIWWPNDVDGLALLDSIHRRLLPHFRLQHLTLKLNQLEIDIDRVLNHPAMGRANHLWLPIDADRSKVLAAIARLADTDLPDRIESLSFSVLRTWPVGDGEALVDIARERLGSRMRIP